MTFSKVTVESFQAGPQYFNGKPITTLVGRSKDAHISGILQLEGAATLFDGISVYGNVDGLPFSSRTVLLNDQDQSLDGSISVRSASVNNLDAESLNNVNASKFFHDTVKVKGYHDIYKPTVLKNVQVFDMKIDGHFNGVDLESIVNSTLKVCGDQTLIGQWRFEKLTCENFKLGLISGYDLEKDFVKTHGSEYNIDGELDFNAPLTVKHLYVVDDFNGISVSKGKLDVLQLQPDETVTVTGKKEFDLLNIKSDMTVLESFNDLSTEEWNYVKTVSGPLELNEDAVIHGKISINGDLKTGDFRDSSGKFSLKKVLKHGIKLGTPVVAVKSLTISGIIEAENVQAEIINGIRTESWVKKNEEVTITALKIFDGGIQVLKPLEVTGLINGVDLISLDKDVLKTYGDQTIDGLKIFKYMDALSLTTGECLFGNQWCNDLLFTNEDQIINGSNLITGSVNVLRDFSVFNLTVEGYVAGYDLNFLIKDTLFDNDKNPVVKAEKTFRGPLSFENLEVSGNIGVPDIRSLLDLHYVKQYTTDGSIIMNQPTTISNIQLTGWLNGIPHEDFGSAWLLHSEDQTIKGDQVFKSVITKQNVVLLSGKVNEWNLQDKVENAAMVNENSYLGSVKLGKATTGSLKLEGLIQGLNFSTDIVFKDDKEIKISAKKEFKTKLVIEGEMVGNGFKDQFNFEKICQLFMGDTPSAMKLAVEGNVEMDVEPIVENLNDMNLPDIFSTAWMADRDTILYGHKAFNAMIFNDEVEVKGLVDGVDVKSLPQRYLSKTKDQVINGVASFPGGMIFEKTLTAQKAFVEGKVSGINPEYFIAGVLLSGPDQTFTGVPKFEEISTEGNLDVLTVNGMNLDQDVMLWDRDLNVIKGKLEVKSLFVDELILEEGATVQGIDIPQWERLAVKLYGDEENAIQVIKGTKTMIDAEFRSNLWIEGKLDQLEFDHDHIMLISEEQIVKGKKSFVQNPSLPNKNSLIANEVEIIGHLNDVDISDFFSRLVHKNEDITFTVPKTFTSPMMAENVIIKGLYHGVDISGTGLNEVSGIYSKMQQEYDELYSLSEIFQESLKRRAIYVSHYEFVHDLEGGGLVLPVTLHGSKPLLAVISKGNETSALLHIHEWDTDSGLLTEGGIGIDFENLLYATSLQCSKTSFVYIEFSNDTLKARKENFETRDISIEGYVLEYTLKDGFSKSNIIETKGTTSAVPVPVPLQKSCCFFLAQWYGQYSFIVCQRGSLDQMVVFQKIQANKIHEASSGFIGNSPYVAYVMDADEFPEKVGSKLHVWVYADEAKFFVKLQEILVEGARSLASTEYHDISYLAVTSGSVPHAVQPGMIKIYRFDPDRMIFVHWVNLEVTLPWAVKFSVLPSDELVLYVATKNPKKPFIVYLYKGVAGFKELTYAAHAPTYSQITTFNAGHWNNLVVLSSAEETKFFKPAFKGI
ncbi:uncharacterized protein [Hetaerina americana]|uniref:uncharacterized protein n=1 Tax=Hetaerina americana TaxID=62018 RepID=UPI003A7F4F6E